MLEALFGNSTLEKVLFYLHLHGQAYARGVAARLGLPLSGVQMQLKRLEKGGVVVSHFLGRNRMYKINPDYAFRKPLRKLLKRAFQALPSQEIAKYYPDQMPPRQNQEEEDEED